MVRNLLFFLLTGVSYIVSGQSHERILILNGYLHVGNGTVIESALIGTENGIIKEVANSLSATYNQEDWDTVIDVQGQHIYPAFVAPNSTLGLTEIDAIRATRDFEEVGQYNPHIRSQIAYNVESNVISTVRTNGVLLTQATPRGGVVSGTSSVMALAGWNWEDATIFKDDGIHVNWPNSIQYSSDTGEKKRQEHYDEEKRALYSFFQLAKTYAKTNHTNQKDLRLEAMQECFDDKKRVYVHADELQQLLDIIDFVNEFELAYPVIVGGYDSYLIADKLKDEKIPVMLRRLHSLPQQEEESPDLMYRIPGLLQRAGVSFCLQNEGDMEAMNARNIPFLAGTAMTYGLTEEQAIRSVSLSACEILGIDKHFGSVEKGKSATLFVSNGNALDMRTNQVTLLLIDGTIVPTDNFQSDLFKKYTNKYAH
jgi:imidazolonepropionase-like amidohydrolase